MTDYLEKTIRENKKAFEEDAPEGHFERFERKLNNDSGKHKKPGWKQYLQIAAVILLVTLAGNQARVFFTDKQEKPMSLASVSSEYGEVEFYYTLAIDLRIREWQKLTNEGFITPTEQHLMEIEMNEFDETYAQLQNELKTNPEDDRVISAMLELYQAKLSIITLIIDKLEDINQQKLTNNEIKI